MTGLKWTRKTTAKIAWILEDQGISVSPNTVARLLYQMDFSLRVNRKSIASNSSRDRNQQFQYIGSLRTRFERQGLPIVSVDSKKREMIGNFKPRVLHFLRTFFHVADVPSGPGLRALYSIKKLRSSSFFSCITSSYLISFKL
jgi:Rhodopirellula transposase DDE domain